MSYDWFIMMLGSSLSANQVNNNKKMAYATSRTADQNWVERGADCRAQTSYDNFWKPTAEQSQKSDLRYKFGALSSVQYSIEHRTKIGFQITHMLSSKPRE